MRKIYLSLFIGLIPYSIQAQSLSIQELWSKISETNPIKQEQLNVNIASKAIALQKINKLPVIYGESTLQYNLIIPSTPVPAVAFDPLAQDGVYLPLKFATRWNMKAGVQAEWQIFNPNQKSSEVEKKILLEKAVLSLNENKQQIKKEATLAYASVVLSSLQYQTARKDSILCHEILQTTKIRYDAGRESSEQLSLAMQELEQRKIEVFETWAVLQESDLELHKYIDLENVKMLSSSIEDIKKVLKDYQSINYDIDKTVLDIKLKENERLGIKDQLLPSVTLNGFYGSQFFNTDLTVFNTTKWYGNSYANISLKVPISSFIVQNLALQKVNSELELGKLKMEESQKFDEIHKAKKINKIFAAEQKVDALLNIVTLSKENLDKVNMEYQAGKILWSDYNRNLTNHSINLKKLWQAEFDLISLYLD